MHYVMSDIHGQYDQYIKLLKKINFNDNDVLYVLGDVVDRGPHPIKVLQDMMLRFIVYPLIGNHEYMFLEVLQFLMNEITEESIQELEDHDERLEAMQLWLEDGGKSTLDEFMQLNREEMYNIIDYLEEFTAYEEVQINNNDFILVHAGLDNFSKDRSLDSYDLYELIFERMDYSKQYFDDKYIITGHTPTRTIKDNPTPGYIYKNNRIIDIDCGSVFGGKLAVLCLETMEEFYELII